MDLYAVLEPTSTVKFVATANMCALAKHWFVLPMSG